MSQGRDQSLVQQVAGATKLPDGSTQIKQETGRSKIVRGDLLGRAHCLIKEGSQAFVVLAG